MLQAVIFAFIAVLAAIAAIYLCVIMVRESPAAELKRRLRQMSEDSKYGDVQEGLRSDLLKEAPPFEKYVERIPFLKYVDKFIDQCGFRVNPAVFLIIIVLIVAGSFLVVYMLRRSCLLAAFVTLGVVLGVFIYLVDARKRMRDAFTEQLPDALTMIARSLRAGHSLTSAVELVGNETPDPMGGLFRGAYEQQKLGLWMPHALASILQRVDSLDLRFFVTVVTIHSETGGNLAEILDKLAGTIRERLVLRRQVRVYTAQGRFSGYILVALPVIAFFLLQYLMMPGYEDVFLNETKGHYMLGYACVSQVIGFLIIRQIINIRI